MYHVWLQFMRCHVQVNNVQLGGDQYLLVAVVNVVQDEKSDDLFPRKFVSLDWSKCNIVYKVFIFVSTESEWMISLPWVCLIIQVLWHKKKHFHCFRDELIIPYVVSKPLLNSPEPTSWWWIRFGSLTKFYQAKKRYLKAINKEANK